MEAVDLASVAGPESVIRLEFIGGGFELDSVQFASPTQKAYDGLTERRVITAAGSSTRIELEYDEGGQGVAYYDKTPGNSVGEFRSDEDVDATSSLLTNEVFDGEWLEYTTDIEAGVYDITLKKAWNAGDDAAVKLFIADSNSACSFSILARAEEPRDLERWESG